MKYFSLKSILFVSLLTMSVSSYAGDDDPTWDPLTGGVFNPTSTTNTISVYKQGATLFVQNPNPDFSFTVSLYTAKGVLVDVECFPQSEQNYVALPIDALPAGRYRVMVVTAEGESFHATITL
ncbi:MAG: hypothetical protein MJZ69_09050 [Bacteroidaceae bacterium]|nr:hypothetical protein [Bacteroidaceae bacterium]MDO4955494.1 hypothetical protein [Bacteroidales bacterium]